MSAPAVQKQVMNSAFSPARLIPEIDSGECNKRFHYKIRALLFMNPADMAHHANANFEIAQRDGNKETKSTINHTS